MRCDIRRESAIVNKLSLIAADTLLNDNQVDDMRVVKGKSRERRRDRRIQEMPIKVDLNGSSYETANWSLGGFLLYSFYGDFQIGDIPVVGIKAEVGNQQFHHVTRAEIV